MRAGGKFLSAVFFLLFTASVFAESAVSLFDRAMKKQQEGNYYTAVELYRESVLKNPFELFEEFFKTRELRSMTDDEKYYILSIIKEIEEEDNETD